MFFELAMYQQIPFSPLAEPLYHSGKISFARVICTLNFVIAITGYPLFMSLLSGVIPQHLTDSSTFTWPLRILFTIISILAFFLGNTNNAKFDFALILFIIFWALYLTRATSDLVLTPASSFDTNFAWKLAEYNPNVYLQSWGYILGFTLLPLLSVYRSWENIDYEQALNFILFVGTIAILLSIYTTSLTGQVMLGADATERIGGNEMVNTISFGNLGTSIAFLAAFKFLHTKYFSLWKIVAIFSFTLGSYVMLRAGSRGPLVAYIFVFLFWFSSYGRNIIFISILSLIGFFVLYFFSNQLLELISNVSPVLAARMEQTLLYGEGSGREFIFLSYIKESLNHSLTGFQLDILGYSHNAIIDSFMMFGWVVGWIVPIILLIGLYRTYEILKYRLPISWVAIFFIQYFIAIQMSGTFGANSFVQTPLLFIFLFWMKYRLKN